MNTRTIITLVVGAVATSAFAQFTSITESGITTGSNGSLEGTVQSNESQSHEVSGNLYQFHVKGDIFFQAAAGTGQRVFQTFAYFTITTGNAPVLLENIELRWNGKEVNSGGVGASVNSINFIRGQIFASGFGTDTGAGSYLTQRDGQGIWIEDLSLDSTPSPTILNANTAYTVYMDVFPIYNVTEFPQNSSQAGYNLEFGGLHSTFDGLTYQFNATAVPEPATMSILGVAAVAALARKRRK